MEGQCNSPSEGWQRLELSQWGQGWIRGSEDMYRNRIDRTHRLDEFLKGQSQEGIGQLLRSLFMETDYRNRTELEQKGEAGKR